MDNVTVENMGLVLAAIVTVSLALAQAVGPLVMYLTEAVKATGKIKEGYSGLIALLIGVALGASLGWLTDAIAHDSLGTATMIGLGAFAGALMAATAVSTYKAVGDVNPKTAASPRDDTDPEPETSIMAMRANVAASTPMSTTPMSQDDIDAMQTALNRQDDYVQDPDLPNVTKAPPI